MLHLLHLRLKSDVFVFGDVVRDLEVSIVILNVLLLHFDHIIKALRVRV